MHGQARSDGAAAFTRQRQRRHIGPEQVGHAQGAGLGRTGRQCFTIHHADEPACDNDRVGAVALARAEVTGQRVGDGHFAVHADHRARHHLVHPVALQRVDTVFAVDVLAAAGDFLGEDGARHRQHRETVGHR